ncbi:MAG: hypothetical protein ACYTBY_09635 [Planctomycetota bacterium]|jgi:hypothetical protein
MSDDCLVETVEEILSCYRLLIEKFETNSLQYPEQWKFEELSDMRDAVDDLKNADHYYVGNQFDEMIDEYSAQYEGLPVGDVIITEDARLPAKLSFIIVEEQRQRMKVAWDTEGVPEDDAKKIDKAPPPSATHAGFMCREFEDGSVDIRLLTSSGPPMLIGYYKPSSFNGVNVARNLDMHKDAALGCVVRVAASFDIINQPRFVVREAASSRQQRRAAKKAHGIAVEAWHKIEWNIDEPVVSKDNQGRSFKMPLHWTRGHWRKAQPHWDDVCIRKDGLPYIWIKGFWSGHPAYGCKRGYHVPNKKEAA